MMTRAKFDEQLETLALRAMAILTRSEFEQVFSGSADAEAKRHAAIVCAEDHACRLVFRQSHTVYAVFTRRQHRHEVRSSARG